MQALFLVGFMGAGKTSVGRHLAQQLGWTFTDLDDAVVARDGRSVRDIFHNSGEATFRELEFECLRELLIHLSENTVVSLGGGAYVQPKNFELISRSGHTVVHLDADVEELIQRCREQGSQRPLLADENLFRQLYGARRDGYMKADVHIATSNKSVDEVAAEIVRKLGLEVK